VSRPPGAVRTVAVALLREALVAIAVASSLCRSSGSVQLRHERVTSCGRLTPVQPLHVLFPHPLGSEFGQGGFAPGYHDRVAGEQRIVPFGSITFDSSRPGFFSIQDGDGAVCNSHSTACGLCVQEWTCDLVATGRPGSRV
jgi:hypothetical protein